MPLALEPNEFFEIVLESDKKKKREEQPRFIYLYLTCRQWRQIARIQDEMEKAENADQMMDKIFEAATTELVSWVNMVDRNGKPIVFDKNKFEDVISMPEAQELIAKLLAQRPSFADKKKLDSQLDSSSAESVKDAQDKKNAKTSQQ